MFDTFFSLPDYEAAQPTGKASLARGYSWVNRTQEYYRLASFDAPVLSGAGLVISNVLDYAKWLRCMISEALPLSPAGHNALRWPRINNPPIGGEETGFRGPDGYSLGWLISNYRGETMIWHNGAVPGFATVMLYLPRLQWGLVMMANSMEGGSVAEVILVYRLIDNLLDVPDQERFDWGASEESDIEKHLKMLKNPKEALYPNAPSKENAIPLTLPLQEYTGVISPLNPVGRNYRRLTSIKTYKHAAYPNITITLRPGSRSSLYQESSEPQHILHISTQDEQYPLYIDFMHVSGEYFVIYIRHFEEGDPKYYEPWRDSVSKAEFRLDESGKAKELGLLIEEKMGDDKIWYRKVT